MKLTVLCLVFLSAWFCFPRKTLAQSETPYDLVNAVNALRALHGLEPYQVDPWLMAYAQEHADYMAANRTSTHVHSDGTRPQDIGLQENVAAGDVGVVTVDVVVYKIWVDWGHRHILTGYTGGEIGAGVAFTDDDQVYYAVDIRLGEGAVTVTPDPGTPAPFVPLETSIPGEDGSIIHTVGYGQTLWGIALSYGVSVDEIRRLNSFKADSTLIFPTQKLLIRTAYTLTPTLPGGLSPTPAAINKQAIVPFTETVPPTGTDRPKSSSTPVPTSIPVDESTSNKNVGQEIVLVICFVGILVAAILGFRKSGDDKMIDDHQ